MIVVKLRDVMEEYYERTEEKLTYAEVAHRTELARATIEAIGSRSDYNPRLSTIDKLCEALGCDVCDLLEYVPSASEEDGGGDE